MAGVEHCIRREGEKQLVTKFLHDVKERTSANAFSKLQLIQSQKSLIRDLVMSNVSGTGAKPLTEDIMKEKRKGFVILLHGKLKLHTRTPLSF